MSGKFILRNREGFVDNFVLLLLLTHHHEVRKERGEEESPWRVEAGTMAPRQPLGWW